MSSSSSRPSSRVPFVADASVIINLIATGRPREIIEALGHPCLVTENACLELEEGARKGHDDHAELMKLISAGVVTMVSLGDTALVAYEQLVDGSYASTLDDGEAATIAHAQAISAVPLLDERKARSVCAASFPNLRVLCSAELLMDLALTAKLGSEGLKSS